MAKPQVITNDRVKLVPQSKVSGAQLTFDFPAVHVGIAEYAEGPTGCTVFYFPNGATTACDIRGGLPGTIMAGDGYTDAICFAGGSVCGLEAATGVTAELFARRHYSIDYLPVVRGAIIFDYARDNRIYPDKALGRMALKTAHTGGFS